MVLFNMHWLFAAISFLGYIHETVSTPLNSTAYDGLGSEARYILSRATPAAPHFVIYGDQYVSGQTGPPPVAQIQVHRAHLIQYIRSPKLLGLQRFCAFILAYRRCLGQGRRMDSAHRRPTSDGEIPVCSCWNQACSFFVWLYGRTHLEWKRSDCNREYDGFLGQAI